MSQRSRRLPLIPAVLTLGLLAGYGPAAVAASSSAPPSSAASSSAAPVVARTNAVGVPVGFTTADGSGTVTVNSASRSAKPDSFGRAPQHGAFLILDVTLTVAKGTAAVGPAGLTAQDAAGDTVQPSPGVAANDLTGDLIPAGQTTRGQIAFDVQAGAVTVTWATPLGQTIATWTIPG